MVRDMISSHANNPSHRVGKIWNYGLYLVQPRQNPTSEQGTVLVEADVCVEVSLRRRCRAHSAMKAGRRLQQDGSGDFKNSIASDYRLGRL